jgi:outer membrane protein
MLIMKGYLFFVLSLLGFAASAQTRVSGSEPGEPYSLKTCVEYALKNNLNIKQAQNAALSSKVQLDQSKYLKYPTVNGQYNLNGNAGRNVDPFSNSIVTNAIGTNNVGVGTSINLYNGGQFQNTVIRNELSLKAAELDIDAQRNTISLQVAVAYLNVLSTEDLIEVANKQLEVTKIQYDRTQKLVNGGALPETNLFDLDAQLANDELNLINAENNHEAAILTLKQAMNAPLELQLRVSRIDLPEPSLANYNENASEIYKTAIGYLPEIKANETRLLAADRNIAISKALGKPTISANASWGTAYSSVAKKLVSTGTSANPIPVSAEFQGQTIPFVINFPQQTYDRQNIPYFSQLGNNQNLNLGLSLRVPIFNGYNQKYQLQSSKIQKMQLDLQNQQTKLQIKQSIDQAYINMLNAKKRYSATQTQANALEKSFKAIAARFNAGASTFIDYTLSKTNLDRAKTNLIVAKYDYIFRIKVLDFYQNKPIDL